MNRQQSSTFIERARATIPGGVNSPVRAFGGVGGDPVFFAEGDGAYLVDVDGNRYIDYVASWGPMLFGHTDQEVVDAVVEQARKSLGYGAPTELEIELAELVVDCVPSIEKVRMVSSGTEATMSAIRLARGFTGRDLLVKFTGCYHGHSDSLLVKAGSGVLTLGIPNSPGVPAAIAEMTLTLPFNDPDAIQACFEQNAGKIAAVILEPVAGNMGCIPPNPGFLETLRELTEADGAVLIFDEVMTGFRVARGGAQEKYGVTPDLTTLGKIIGGGLPVGAFGGRADIMSNIAPEGGVYQAGTLSGNPLAVSAGLTMLRRLTPDVYTRIESSTNQLIEGLVERARAAGHRVTENHVCGMFSLFLDADQVTNYDQVANTNVDKFSRFFHAMLDEGVYLAPSAFEAGFVSTKHDDAVVQSTLDAAERAFAKL